MNFLILITFLLPFSLSGKEPAPAEYPDLKNFRGNNRKIPKTEKSVRKNRREFYYSKNRRKKKSRVHKKGIEKPYRVGSDGSFYYSKRKNEGKKSFNILSILVGTYTPPDIQFVKGGRNYQEMYSNKNQFLVRFEYELRLFKYEKKLIHSFFMKFGSGFTQASGEGQFVGENQGIKPREKFRFFIIPTTVSISYKLDFLKTSYLTPYVDGGMGYFGFAETRSDHKKNHYGGAFVSSLGFGMLISLSQLFQNQLTMFSEYGISQSWLNLQYQKITGLDERKDFTSEMITGGFAFGF